MGWAEGKEELRGLVRHRKQTCKRDECCLPERWGVGCHMWSGGQRSGQEAPRLPKGLLHGIISK